MTQEKFKQEINDLEKFFSLYCKENHAKRDLHRYDLEYKEREFKKEIHLCDTCHELISYSFEKLLACPHEIKPKCRTCKSPCYDKKEWKALAKIMRYSAIHLQLGRFAKFIMKPFS